jgi:uncharacterized membrane protein
MTTLETIARVAEPWARAYGDSTLLMNGVTFAHVGGFLIAGGLALSADRAVLGHPGPAAASTFDPYAFESLHTPILLGLGVTFLSGVLLFLSDVETYATSPVFWSKMGLLALLLGNGAALRRTARRMSSSAEPDRSWRVFRRSARASSILWLVAVLTGVMLVNL